MVLAFEIFEEIDKLKLNEEKQKLWLKQYEGKKFSIGDKGKDLIYWKKEEDKYVYYDSRFHESIKTIKGDEIFLNKINKIQRHERIFVIEFDDHVPGTNLKDKEKISQNIKLVKELLEKNNIGYIESTHNGNSNYIWIEYERDLKDKEIEEIIKILAPINSEADVNFASSNKRLPILFAPHWKYGIRELPINFYKGEKLSDEIISKISLEKKPSEIKEINVNGYRTSKITPLDIIKNYMNKTDLSIQLYKVQPYFYDKSGLWWIWSNEQKKWEIVDDTEILIMVSNKSDANTISSTERNEIIESMKQYGRKRTPKPVKRTWIQFVDKIYDIEDGSCFDATPEYFVTNPIPWKVSGDPRTPIMDRIFEEWVGKKYVPLLYEIIAYSLLPDYPINRLFCLIGGGMNGKSKFLELLQIFVGIENVCSTELDTLISSRFEVTRLHKKLVCLMGETNFGEISKTSILKKLTGKDVIGFEYKNKNPFEDYNYAKIIIATNNLPTTTDKTIGFYRRWCIVDFPNTFSEKKDILMDIPKEEYSNLAYNSIVTLNKLLKAREFTNEGTIEERAKKYEDKSDPLEKFIKEFTEEDQNGFIWKFQFEKQLNEWCIDNKFRQMSDIVIGKKMKEKGINQGQKQSDWLIEGKYKTLRVWEGIKWIGGSKSQV